MRAGVLRCGYRAGDAAPMAYIERVDRPQPVAAATEDDATPAKGAKAEAAAPAGGKKSRKKAAAAA